MKKNIRFIKKEQNGGNIKKLIRIQIKNKSNLSDITHLFHENINDIFFSLQCSFRSLCWRA